MTNLITTDDIVLYFNTNSAGSVYVNDSTSLGKTYTVDMLLDEPGDSCPRIVILNTKTLISSDVTEIFAQAWLKRADAADELEVDGEEYSLADLESTLPIFVRNSRDWAVRKDDIEAMAPVLPDTDRAFLERRELRLIASAEPAMFRARQGLDASTGVPV
jgi:hypothetical protein